MTQNRQQGHTSSAPFSHLKSPTVLAFPSKGALQTALALIKQGINRGLLQAEQQSCVTGNNRQLPPHRPVLLIVRAAGVSPFRDVFALPDCGSVIGAAVRQEDSRCQCQFYGWLCTQVDPHSHPKPPPGPAYSHVPTISLLSDMSALLKFVQSTPP